MGNTKRKRAGTHERRHVGVRTNGTWVVGYEPAGYPRTASAARRKTAGLRTSMMCRRMLTGKEDPGLSRRGRRSVETLACHRGSDSSCGIVESFPCWLASTDTDYP
jgi:hypothetical protein